MELHIGISTIHVRPGRSGSHEPYMVNLVRALSELDTANNFTLFVTPANRSLFETQRDNFRLVVLPSLSENVLARIGFEQFVLPLYAYLKGLDLVHYGGTAGSLFLRRSDVVTIHHDSITARASMSWFRNLYFDWVLRFNSRAGLLIAPTKHYAHQLCKHYGYHPEQMRVIHHGTNPAFCPLSRNSIQLACKEWGIEPGAMMTVTNMLPHKNIPNLLRAFELLLTRFQLNKQLVLIGNIDQKALKRVIGDVARDPNRLISRLCLIPFLPNDQLPPLYGAASVFLFLSLTESFGIPLVEAMACGLPILASDIPAHQEVLAEAGRLVSPTDVEAIAEAMYVLSSDEILRDRMRMVALARSEHFTWDEAARKTLQVYEEACQLSLGSS